MRATASANQSIQLRRSLQAVSSFFCRVISFLWKEMPKGEWVVGGGARKLLGGVRRLRRLCALVSHRRGRVPYPNDFGGALLCLMRRRVSVGGEARARRRRSPLQPGFHSQYTTAHRDTPFRCAVWLSLHVSTQTFGVFFRQLYVRSLGQHGLLPSLSGQQ